MTLKGDALRYGSVQAALHWMSAAAILVLLALGLAAAASGASAPKAALLQAHAPLGLFTLALTIARIGWRFFDRRPDEPAGQPHWQSVASRSVHALLTLATLAMGASGTALMALSGAGAVLFAGAPGPLPDFWHFRPMTVHAAGAAAMAGLLCLHVGAALHHQFVRHDRLLGRMGVGPVGAAAE